MWHDVVQDGMASETKPQGNAWEASQAKPNLAHERTDGGFFFFFSFSSIIIIIRYGCYDYISSKTSNNQGKCIEDASPKTTPETRQSGRVTADGTLHFPFHLVHHLKRHLLSHHGDVVPAIIITVQYMLLLYSDSQCVFWKCSWPARGFVHELASLFLPRWFRYKASPPAPAHLSISTSH